MTFVLVKDMQGQEEHLNMANIAKVKFGHRNVDLREKITITYANGAEIVVQKEYGDAIRAAMYPRGPLVFGVGAPPTPLVQSNHPGLPQPRPIGRPRKEEIA